MDEKEKQIYEYINPTGMSCRLLHINSFAILLLYFISLSSEEDSGLSISLFNAVFFYLSPSARQGI